MLADEPTSVEPSGPAPTSAGPTPSTAQSIFFKPSQEQTSSSEPPESAVPAKPTHTMLSADERELYAQIVEATIQADMQAAAERGAAAGPSESATQPAPGPSQDRAAQPTSPPRFSAEDLREIFLAAAEGAAGSNISPDRRASSSSPPKYSPQELRDIFLASAEWGVAGAPSLQDPTAAAPRRRVTYSSASRRRRARQERRATPSDIYSEEGGDEADASRRFKSRSTPGGRLVPVVRRQTPQALTSAKGKAKARSKDTPTRRVRWSPSKTNPPLHWLFSHVEIRIDPTLPRTKRAQKELMEASSSGGKAAAVSRSRQRSYDGRGRKRKRQASSDANGREEGGSALKKARRAVEKGQVLREHEDGEEVPDEWTVEGFVDGTGELLR
jgi:hypothetical protein